MENLVFRKGSPVVKKEILKNTWIIHFSNMSGDGDHYEEETLKIEDYADIIDIIIIYATRWFLPENDRYDDDIILEAADTKGIELGMTLGQGSDLYMDITGTDITNGHFQAKPDKCWITWCDKQGIEYTVEIVNNGKVFSKINEGNIKEVLNKAI